MCAAQLESSDSLDLEAIVKEREACDASGMDILLINEMLVLFQEAIPSLCDSHWLVLGMYRKLC